MSDSTVPEGLRTSVDNTKVEYVRLGKSGLKVSVPILGAMSIGSSEWQPWVLDEEKALTLLKAAFDCGLNTWDTADVYSNGISEEIIGKAIKKYSIPRDKLVIMSKCYAPLGDKPSDIVGVHHEEVRRSKDWVNRHGTYRTYLAPWALYSGARSDE